MASLDELRTAAHGYAVHGIRVFPVLAGRKEPATAHGVLDASTEPAMIDAWWASVPYLIGLACGPESGIFVVDVDPRNGGAWESPVPTVTARSGGRYEGVVPGAHYYFKWPAGVAKMRPTLAKGIDIIGKGKYVIAPPSVTQAGYEFIPNGVTEPADAPSSLLMEIALAEGAATRPGDRFQRDADVA
jgi:hypothetical protein